MSLSKQELVGTYRLFSGEMQRADRTIGYPFGKEAVGYLLYLDSGYMSWHIMAGNGEPFAQYGLNGGTPEENDRVFRTSLSYWARYSIEGDELWYDVEVCPIPNLVGRRSTHSHAELRRDKLSLAPGRFWWTGRGAGPGSCGSGCDRAARANRAGLVAGGDAFPVDSLRRFG